MVSWDRVSSTFPCVLPLWHQLLLELQVLQLQSWPCFAQSYATIVDALVEAALAVKAIALSVATTRTTLL